MKYEYQVDDFEGEYSKTIQQRVFTSESLMQRLKNFGDGGWELVFMSESRDKVRMVLRRQVP